MAHSDLAQLMAIRAARERSAKVAYGNACVFETSTQDAWKNAQTALTEHKLSRDGVVVGQHTNLGHRAVEDARHALKHRHLKRSENDAGIQNARAAETTIAAHTTHRRAARRLEATSEFLKTLSSEVGNREERNSDIDAEELLSKPSIFSF